MKLCTLPMTCIGFAVLLCTSCAHAPDPQAPVVLKEAQQVEVPVAVHREPPPEWLQPLGLEAPDILPAGQGDYCMSRESTRQYIAVIRAAAERLNGWKAWASD